MKFDRVKLFAVRCRRRMGRNGCKDCGRVLPQGLFLEGAPGLSDMVRDGQSVRVLKQAMRERGWYCRTCVNRRGRKGTAAATIRDQFPSQEAYMEFLYWKKQGDQKFSETYGRPYSGLRLNP